MPKMVKMHGVKSFRDRVENDHIELAWMPNVWLYDIGPAWGGGYFRTIRYWPQQIWKRSIADGGVWLTFGRNHRDRFADIIRFLICQFCIMPEYIWANDEEGANRNGKLSEKWQLQLQLTNRTFILKLVVRIKMYG